MRWDGRDGRSRARRQGGGGPATEDGRGPAGAPPARSFDRLPEVFDRLGELIGGELLAYLDGALPRRGERAVDLGCGTGRHAELLAGRYRQVLAVDVSQPMLDLAVRRRGRAGVTFARRDLRDLRPERDGRFDLVLSAHTLHHVDDLDATLERIRELVAPGGRAVLVDNVAARPAVPRGWFVREAVRGLALDLAKRRRPPREAVELFRLSTHPAWLDHVTADRFLSPEQFDRHYARAFPGAELTPLHRSRACCWTAP